MLLYGHLGAVHTPGLSWQCPPRSSYVASIPVYLNTPVIINIPKILGQNVFILMNFLSYILLHKRFQRTNFSLYSRSKTVLLVGYVKKCENYNGPRTVFHCYRNTTNRRTLKERQSRRFPTWRNQQEEGHASPSRPAQSWQPSWHHNTLRLALSSSAWSAVLLTAASIL